MSFPKTKEFSCFNSKYIEDEWKFGYDEAGTPKSRIIVTSKDKNGKEFIRQYDKEVGAVFYCVGCLKKQLLCYGKFVDGIFSAPVFHFCNRISVAANAEEQQEKEIKFFNHCKELVPASTV